VISRPEHKRKPSYATDDASNSPRDLEHFLQLVLVVLHRWLHNGHLRFSYAFIISTAMPYPVPVLSTQIYLQSNQTVTAALINIFTHKSFCRLTMPSTMHHVTKTTFFFLNRTKKFHLD
jgi:hypothetical protein